MGPAILIIDDAESYKNKLKLMFEHEGHRVHTSSSVDKAVSLVNGLVRDNKLPELIILELRLSGTFGLSALRAVQGALAGNRVPIVIASWGFDKLAQSHMAIMGAMGYVEKPVLLTTLYSFAVTVMKEHKVRLNQEQSIESDFLADLDLIPKTPSSAA